MGVHRFVLSSEYVCFVLPSGEKPSILFDGINPCVVFSGIPDNAQESFLLWCIPVIISYFYQIGNVIPIGFFLHTCLLFSLLCMLGLFYCVKSFSSL